LSMYLVASSDLSFGRCRHCREVLNLSHVCVPPERIRQKKSENRPLGPTIYPWLTRFSPIRLPLCLLDQMWAKSKPDRCARPILADTRYRPSHVSRKRRNAWMHG